MAKALKPLWRETPILYGEDARRFLQRMKNPPKLNDELKEKILRSGEAAMSVFEEPNFN